MNELVGDTTRIEDRLALLEAERAIHRTLDAYAAAIDYGDPDTWALCFTEDATFDVGAGPGAGGSEAHTHRGREALRAFAASHPHAPDALMKHMMVHRRIELDGDGATVVSDYLVLREVDGMPAVRSFGRYYDDFVREADGAWRIRMRKVRPECKPAALDWDRPS